MTKMWYFGILHAWDTGLQSIFHLSSSTSTSSSSLFEKWQPEKWNCTQFDDTSQFAMLTTTVSLPLELSCFGYNFIYMYSVTNFTNYQLKAHQSTISSTKCVSGWLGEQVFSVELVQIHYGVQLDKHVNPMHIIHLLMFVSAGKEKLGSRYFTHCFKMKMISFRVRFHFSASLLLPF